MSEISRPGLIRLQGSNPGHGNVGYGTYGMICRYKQVRRWKMEFVSDPSNTQCNDYMKLCNGVVGSLPGRFTKSGNLISEGTV